jgi:dihydrofolate reductase (EC 1.5.1.3)
MIYIIVAMDEDQLIGQAASSNGMPWNYPEDLDYFKNTTLNKTIVMGSTTYKAIGRPLQNRKTIVVSCSCFEDTRVEVRNSFDEVIQEYKASGEDLYICGGASIYQQSLDKADQLLISRIPGSHIGETYFPDFSGYGYTLQETIPYKTFILERYSRVHTND